VRKLLAARRHCSEFVERCAQEILRRRPRVVCFTTTFQQTCACLALAHRIKQFADPPVIVFGGANCEGEMGLQFLCSFPWIDYVCTGEGDLVFPEFLKRLLREGDARPLPGLLKQGTSVELTTPAPVQEMDSLPSPDYSDYFEQLKASPLRAQLNNPALLIQTSRGCWWGAKQHCTFCGLNDATMAFRSRSAYVVLSELTTLTKKHRVHLVICVDNIFDLRYIHTLFPKLIEHGPKVKFFYETKANLRFQQLSTMRAGGVRSIQPGIESFSNQVLKLMQKGCTGLQNIQLLRWCRELRIYVAWNIIYGFAGESPAEYQRMAEWIPLLTHLKPPQGSGPIRLDRFGPYFNHPEAFGLRNVRPYSYYRFVFPLGIQELQRLAYYFEFDWPEGQNPDEYTHALNRAVKRWQTLGEAGSEKRPRLDLRQTAKAVMISDTRPCAMQPKHRLKGLAAEIYLRCDTAQTVVSLARDLDSEAVESQIREVLKTLQEAKLMIEDDEHYLSLAVWRNRPREKTKAKSSLEGMPSTTMRSEGSQVSLSLV
jgi:ribosomal peptide maturation radical SAM protein 1